MAALANGPVEALSNIHMEDIAVDNTLGLTETTVQTIDGQPVEITSKKVSLSFNDFIGYTDKGSVIDSEYVEGFEDIFKDQYEQLNIKDCDFDEYIETLSTLGEFSHSMYQPTKEFISGSLDILTFGVKPLMDAIAGGDIITGEKLTDTERVWKVVEGVVSIVTLGGIVSKLGSLGVKVTAKILIIEIAPDFATLGNGMFLESLGVDGKKAGYLSLALGLALGIGGGKWQDEIADLAQQGKHADDILENIDVDDVTEVKRVESENSSTYSGKEWDEYLKEKYGVDKVSWETKSGVLEGGNGSLIDIDKIRPQLKTEPDTAFFWSGRTEGIGGADTAANIAKGKGGVTLESIIAAKKIVMPEWDFNNPSTMEAWDLASGAYAEQVSGEIRAVVGSELRTGNIWENIELPRLKANPNVTKITIIDPKTQMETIIFKR